MASADNPADPISCENQGPRVGKYSHYFCSHQSFVLYFIMSDWNPNRFSVARAVKGDAGGVSIPPCPAFSHNILSSFCPLHSFRIPPDFSLASNSDIPRISKLSTALHHTSSACSIFIPTLKVSSKTLCSQVISDTPSPSSSFHNHVLTPTVLASSAVFTNNQSAAPCRIIKPRKPKAGCKVLNNELCPHVATADCLFAWDTPFGIQQHSQLKDLLPHTLIEPTIMSISGALAPNTKGSYAAGILH